MNETIKEAGYSKYHPEIELYVKSSIKPRGWVHTLIDWLVDCLLSHFFEKPFTFLFDLKYGSRKWLLFFKKILFSFRIMHGNETVYFSKFQVLNMPNLFSVIRDIFYLISNGLFSKYSSE